MSITPHRNLILERLGERRELKSLHREWFVFFDKCNEFGDLAKCLASSSTDYNLLKAQGYRQLLKRIKQTGAGGYLENNQAN